MSRGEGNILYNPPRIIKRRQVNFLNFHEEKTSIGFISKVLFKDGRLLFLNKKNDATHTLYLPSMDGQGRAITREKNIDFPINDNWFLSEVGMVWQEEDSIRVQEARGGFADFPWDKSRKIKHFYLADETLYVLSDAKSSSGSLAMSALSISAPAPAWTEIENYQGQKSIRLEERDAKSILVHNPDQNPSSLTTLSPKGMGQTCALDAKTSLAIKEDLDSSGELKITPGKKDGDYFYLDKNSSENGGIDLCWINLKKSKRRIIKSLSAEEAKDLLDNWNDVKIRSNGEDCVILGVKNLFLIKKDGRYERADIDGKYQDISCSENKIILYTKDSKKYQEVTF